jgi:hypothetical protein
MEVLVVGPQRLHLCWTVGDACKGLKQHQGVTDMRFALPVEDGLKRKVSQGGVDEGQ